MRHSSVRDVPVELKKFHKMFDSIRYTQDADRIFNDLLTIFINFFSNGDFEEERNRAMARYTKQDHQIFNDMFFELLEVQNKMINDKPGSWYDPFGRFYEYLSGYYKRQGFGQFFTPDNVVDMMVKMMGNEDLIGRGEKANDPTSGSGRMLIAFHAHYPGNYQFGEDIDPVCTKMTAVNMLFHGCVGEAICHDSLKPGNWRFGYAINPYLRKTGIISIHKLDKEDSYVMKVWENREVKIDSEPEQKNNEQLSFF